MKPRQLFILASIAAALALAFVAQQTQKNQPNAVQTNTTAEEKDQASKEEKADIGGDFTLTNADGEKVSTQSFQGKVRLVYFGFTSCPAVCPTDLANITHVMRRLGSDAEKVQPIFVTVDPERDTPEVMKKYMENFDVRIVALTGNAKEIAKAAKAYKVYYKKMESEAMPGGYTMDHSAFIYVMDREGKYLTHFGHDEDVIKMEKEIRKFL